MSNHIHDFTQFMADHGIQTRAAITDDGVLHRIHVDGDKPGTLNGWYVLHGDGIPAGEFGSWRTGIQATWSAKPDGEMTHQERKKHRDRLKQMRLQRDTERQQRQQQTADQAARLWSDATSADPAHPYLSRKGIQPHHLRQHGELLLVPMIDATGALWNLQRICPDGTKRFMAGGRVSGCFTLFGDLSAGPVYVAEGVATGATIHEQSGLPTVCAMNAGNLLPVCTALADPERQLTVCADNDHRTQGNPGITKGREAAAAVGAGLTWPDPCGLGCTCTDFNDVAHCAKAQGVAA
ncbi:toprim domain-containing protein [Marinobacterium weihaiense]|uniref:Toprim domain-containing protein n=1 Tax=Marinobacterium weihaiense TaxID=2851016 RepID=A0ABS6M6X4_9GAMM|nr:toprim domain-containing protein [Marinobacterium weihaiense]MBV0932030.1 toprim domain-containing protein [Marinobacterium weihaiense]